MNVFRKLGRITPILLMGFLAAQVSAQTATSTNKPATKPAPPAAKEPAKSQKKLSAGPFHGKLAAVDQVAKTITVGKRTFQITPQTRIKKNGKPATLADGIVGEQVSGYVKPNEAGKLAATVVTFGPKPDTKSAEPKKSSAEAK